MSTKKEELEENPFSGFNLLDTNALSAPSKTKEKTEEKPEAKGSKKETEDEEEKEEDVFEAAKKEIDEKLKENTNKKKEVEKIEEEEEESPEDNSKTSKENEEEEEEEEEGTSLKPFVEHMANKGLIDWSEGEEFEDTEEGLEKLQIKTIQKGIDKWKDSYDEDTKKYLEFVENGGNPRDFHRIYYNEASFEGFSIQSEDDQKYIIKEGLLAAGWNEEDADDEISLYEDANKLEAKAKTHLARLQKLEKDQKELLVEAQKQAAKEQEAKRKADIDAFRKGLFEKDEIAGFKFSPKMKEDLWEYMMKADRKTGQTQYQKDSQEKGAEARYIFAYLMKNNWDASKLGKDMKNKVVSEVKKKLSSYTDTRNKIKAGAAKEKEIETSSSFEGFKNIIVNN